MPEPDGPACLISDLGLLDYDSAFSLQRGLVEAVASGLTGDLLLLLEHPPVLTVGRSGGEHNILVGRRVLQAAGVEVRETDRGGDVTYHGPGQLVGYPIFDLKRHGRDVHLFLRNLEEVLIIALAAFGLQAGRKEGLTGVWVGEAKIAAIGVGVRQWVSFHGFALNIDPDMSHFRLINPCGIIDKPVTSMAALLGEVDAARVKEEVVSAVSQVFRCPLQKVGPEEVLRFAPPA